MIIRRTLKISSGLTILLLTAACAAGSAETEKNLTSTKVDAALERAAQTMENQGTPPSAAFIEKAYLRDPSKPENALRYAATLREADYANKASVVLSPFANNPSSPAAAKTEYAAVQLALGNNEMAEKFAQKALSQDQNDAKAWHYLGIAQDAQGKAPEAEKAFRKALDLWQGDPTPIMNNLALNLSAQGYLEEASQILEKAKALAPDRLEIERNLRIITALRQSENPTTPKPAKRPQIEPSSGY